MMSALHRLLTGRRHVHWVLADQVLVSGSNFALAIVFARALGPAAFGVYALIIVAQQYFVSVSVSLVGNPLITQAPHVEDPDERQRLIASSFSAQLLLSTILAALASIGLTVYQTTGTRGFSAVAILGFAASSFALPLIEWCRRLCFFQRDGAPLFRFDALTYLPVLFLAFFLAQAGALSLDLSILLWGVSSVIAGLYATYRLKMHCVLRGARSFMLKNWRLSKDFLLSFQAQWLGSQGIVYFAAPLVGTAGIGAYRSIAGLLGFTNALGTTLDNMMPIRFAEVYRVGGKAGLNKYTLRFGAMLVVPMLLLLPPMVFFSEALVGFLLGAAYREYARIFDVQVFYICILFISRVAIYHERARLVTHRIAVSATIGAAVSTLSVIFFAAGFGPTGIAWSTVLGAGMSLVYLVIGMKRDS